MAETACVLQDSEKSCQPIEFWVHNLMICRYAHLPAAQEEAHRASGRSCVAGTGGTVGATMDGCITAALDRSVEHGVWPPPRTLTP